MKLHVTRTQNVKISISNFSTSHYSSQLIRTTAAMPPTLPNLFHVLSTCFPAYPEAVQKFVFWVKLTFPTPGGTTKFYATHNNQSQLLHDLRLVVSTLKNNGTNVVK